MIYLLGDMTNGTKKLADTYPRGIGRCYVDSRLDPFKDEPWILDNGVFREWNHNGRDPATDYTKRYEFFESKRPEAGALAAAGRGPLFVVAPDRPGDPASLGVTLAWLDRWEAGLQDQVDPTWWGRAFPRMPVFAAVQDGMTPKGVEDSGILGRVSGLFLGGTDQFKTTALTWRWLTRKHGIQLHYGRCTQSRIAEAISIGCDSADSSHPCRLAGRRWERFLEVFDQEMAA